VGLRGADREDRRNSVFGRGDNPINFVSAGDVARFVELAVADPAMRSQAVDVGGPENHTVLQVVQTYERVLGMSAKVAHAPLPVMRVMSVLMRPINPRLARFAQAGVLMDTADMTFDRSALGRRFPAIAGTTLEEVVRRDFAKRTAAQGAPQ
jgi:nucleoside-diphosphate-sugar epimerase